MMMNQPNTSVPFGISPSEAILIGRCVEFYQQANQPEYTTSFFTILKHYLKPYVPAENDSFIKTEDVVIPDSAEVTENSKGYHFAYSSDTPAMVYLCCGDDNSAKAIAICYCTTRKFLDQLLIEWLIHVLPESYQYHLGSPEQKARVLYDELFRESRPGNHEQSLLPAVSTANNSEDIVSVVASLTDLLKKQNSPELMNFFKIGRILAGLQIDGQRVLIDIQAYAIDSMTFDNILSTMDEEEKGFAYGVQDSQYFEPVKFLEELWPGEWTERCLNHLDQLHTYELVQKSGYALGMISQLRSRVVVFQNIGDPYDSQLLPDQYPLFICLVHEIRSFVMLLQGELCGRNAIDDAEVQQQDSQQLVPRMLQMKPTSTVDKVRGTLNVAQQLFGKQSNEIDPATMIRLLKDCIEALTKRIWPDDFKDKTPLKNVLYSHLKAETEKERNFASNAINLIPCRNSATHQMDSFSIDLEAAFIFYWKMRYLLKLSDEIIDERK